MHTSRALNSGAVIDEKTGRDLLEFSSNYSNTPTTSSSIFSSSIFHHPPLIFPPFKTVRISTVAMKNLNDWRKLHTGAGLGGRGWRLIYLRLSFRRLLLRFFPASFGLARDRRRRSGALAAPAAIGRIHHSKQLDRSINHRQIAHSSVDMIR